MGYKVCLNVIIKKLIQHQPLHPKNYPGTKRKIIHFSTEKVRYRVFFKLEFAVEQRFAYSLMEENLPYQTKPVYQKTALSVLREDVLLSVFLPMKQLLLKWTGS